ncbi:uncharacterized protein BDZ99DRAFT_466511 [Mytilinidion resinicola]|uniref:Apple domain-containing protein n=1 Tax=Mytilinidion resinicola TaxID=574789 RepID=A0A6A6Y9N5_9PEZI|nr:uncharacterized protein BDZ99DRAFT_466511 [Mytilinidion resinicola]KAF2805531.1 hypothetical protein BDZ99DRAFT_466511 [Mytilinidion resinicola]
MHFDRVLGLSVVALAALSTCATAETIRSIDLQARDTPCPSSYESHNGLNFTTYCNQNNPWNDAQGPFETDTMEECMEHCSRYWGDREGCFGIVWNESNMCWLRNSSTSTQGIYPETGTHAALVPRDEVKGVSTDCPFDNLSIQTVRNVEQFTIHCDQVIGGYDLCFDEYFSCLPSPYSGFWHADSLQECMEICADSHPLCQGVSWNPSQTIGFANCWPKTGWQNTLGAATANMQIGVLHSAALTSITPTVNTTCPSGKAYDSKGKTFDINCAQLNTGTNITSIHRANITSCIDACANSDKDCVGVVFDSTMAAGFQNCYLQNTTSVISNNANTTFALLSGTPIPTSSPTNTTSPSSSSKSSSKAWIAGPVIGGVVAIGLIAGGIFWWRRRRSAPVSGTTATGYKDASGYGYSYTPGPPGELHADSTAEMGAAGVGPVKYAHEPQRASVAPQEPQELPS